MFVRISSQKSILAAITNCSDKIFKMWKDVSVAKKQRLKFYTTENTGKQLDSVN